jgi:hypothetical protein
MVVYGIFDILCVVRFFPIREGVQETDQFKFLTVTQTPYSEDEKGELR